MVTTVLFPLKIEKYVKIAFSEPVKPEKSTIWMLSNFLMDKIKFYHASKAQNTCCLPHLLCFTLSQHNCCSLCDWSAASQASEIWAQQVAVGY